MFLFKVSNGVQEFLSKINGFLGTLKNYFLEHYLSMIEFHLPDKAREGLQNVKVHEQYCFELNC